MKCPVCGAEGSLSLQVLYQYKKVYAVKKAGSISQRYRKEDNGPEGWSMVFCEKCGTAWSDSYYEISSDGQVQLLGNGERVREL